MYILSGYTHQAMRAPCLQLDDITTQPIIRRWVPISQQYIHIKLITKRYCIGRYDLATCTSICCPEQKEVSGKQTQCNTCSQTLVFNPAFYHISRTQLSLQQQAYNLRPHDVYLAYFNKRAIKVGIVYAKRLHTRWLEQGARAAVVLKHMPDAYTARSLEEQIHNTYNIPERITSIQKERYLALLYQFSEAKLELGTCREAIEERLGISFTPHSIENLQHFYFPKGQPTTLYQTPKNNKQVVGYGTGLVGDILIYHQNSYYLTLPLKPLIGQTQVILEGKNLSQSPRLEGLQTQLDLFI